MSDRRTIEHEHAAARERVAVIDRSHVSKMRVTGKDSLDLLHRLTTQYFFYKNKTRQPYRDPSEDPDALQPGAGRSAVLITAKARIIDHLIVYALKDSLLTLYSPPNRERVPQWIDQFVFREDFVMTDVTNEQGMLTLTGPQTAAVVERLAGEGSTTLPMHHLLVCSQARNAVECRPDGTPLRCVPDYEQSDGTPLRCVPDYEQSVLVARTWNLAGDTFNLITASENVVNLWNCVMELGQAHGIQLVGEDTYEILRVEAGLPVVGKELSEEVNPWEARLDASIHTAKGCYTGQEVIARIQTYQKVQKRLLTGIRLTGDTLPEPNSKITADGRDVGFVTSAARSPALGCIVLAYVHGQFDDPGVKVAVHTARGDVEGEVAELPFK